MDRYDPNQWTKTFVSDNRAFCFEQLRSTNAKIIALIKQGEYAPAIAGLDRILNGLITMKNAGGDISSELCFFSWVEANIILFGIEAPESKKRETAMMLLEDARDFAKSDASRERLSQLISDLRSGKSLGDIKAIHSANFPITDIEMLSSLDSKLTTSVQEKNPTSQPKTVQRESSSGNSFCRQCGTPIGKGIKFCPNCGAIADASKVSAKTQATIDSLDQAIDLMKNGDERGFSYLYSRTYKYVYARAKCMFNNEESIKELMQRVYLFAHQNIVNLKSSEGVYDWLRAIAFFQGTAIIKRQRKELLFTEEQGAVFSSLIEKENMIEETSLEKKDIDIVSACLERVTDDQKIALVAYYYDNLKIKSIAELLSVNEGTINGRLYLGRKKLEEEVKEQEKRIGREVPVVDKVALNQAIGMMLQKYMDISDAEGKAIFAEICRGLDKGGFKAISNGTPNTSRNTVQKSTQNNSNALIWTIIIVVVACVIAYFLLSNDKKKDESGENSDLNSGNQINQSVDDEEEEEEQEQEEEETEEDSQIDEEEEEEPEQQAPQSEYILPDSNSRYLTDGEVAILTKEELGFARNEIIARHGRIFTNEKYRQYFESKSWYRGVVEPEVFDSNYYEFLNDYEKQNIELIRKYEAMMP